MGGWPILKASHFTNTMNDSAKLAALRYLRVKPFFDIIVTANPKKPASSLLRLKQPGWIVNKEQFDKEGTAYKSYMTTFVSYLGFSEGRDLAGEVDKVFELERKIVQAQISSSLIRNMTYRNMTLEELTTELPDFPWKEYIVNGLYGSDRYNFSVDVNETVLVDHWDYIAAVVGIHKDYLTKQPRVLDNYYIWKFVKDKAVFLPKRYKLARLDYEKVSVYRLVPSGLPLIIDIHQGLKSSAVSVLY